MSFCYTPSTSIYMSMTRVSGSKNHFPSADLLSGVKVEKQMYACIMMTVKTIPLRHFKRAEVDLE